MDVQTYVVLLVAILLGVTGQLLLKVGMSRRPGFRLRDLATLSRDVPVLAGLGCYGLATLLYIRALASLNLSVVFPTVSFGYVLVIIMSKVWFKEPITPSRWIAVLIICAGVTLVGLG